MKCQMCGAEMADSKDDLCPACQQESEWDNAEIDRLKEEGHTHHCACRQIWGDGECECECECGGKEKRCLKSLV